MSFRRIEWWLVRRFHLSSGPQWRALYLLAPAAILALLLLVSLRRLRLSYPAGSFAPGNPDGLRYLLFSFDVVISPLPFLILATAAASAVLMCVVGRRERGPAALFLELKSTPLPLATLRSSLFVARFLQSLQGVIPVVLAGWIGHAWRGLVARQLNVGLPAINFPNHIPSTLLATLPSWLLAGMFAARCLQYRDARASLAFAVALGEAAACFFASFYLLKMATWALELAVPGGGSMLAAHRLFLLPAFASVLWLLLLVRSPLPRRLLGADA